MKKETKREQYSSEPVNTQAHDVLAACCDLSEIADVLSRSFLTAHLLTGNATQAEVAVMQAIDLWNPGEEVPGVLCLRSLRAAAEMMSPHSSCQDQNGDGESYLPNELREFLKFPRVLRGPLVLRFLTGVSARVSAEMLHLDDTEVPEFSGLAIRDST
jgi:hypothetical protein